MTLDNGRIKTGFHTLKLFTDDDMKTQQRIFAEAMLPHYLTCAEWADLSEEIEAGLDFAPCAEENALADCMRFAGINWQMIKDNDPAHVAHDFWLTRNHHGAGFWDRPELYGKENAEALTQSAHSFGQRYVFEHNGQLIIE